jgi:hypothetical protein
MGELQGHREKITNFGFVAEVFFCVSVTKDII